MTFITRLTIPESVKTEKRAVGDASETTLANFGRGPDACFREPDDACGKWRTNSRSRRFE
ncbi:hypothetical protein CHELA20_10930 [Hyphomicrobiales bacterium]|nr:hypothetical protein CHELA20_10930 [Hyphomicrobiales bacterium]CAH1694290.1 hypothetical protein CHELA41_51161 [Hyphomicrobiales bacterium]